MRFLGNQDQEQFNMVKENPDAENEAEIVFQPTVPANKIMLDKSEKAFTVDK